MKKSLLFVAALATIGFTSCGGGEAAPAAENVAAPATEEAAPAKGQSTVVDKDSQANILNIAIGSPDHTTLVAAVQAAEIEDVVVNAGPLTVFAPTNDAFGKLPPGTVETLVKPENKEQLKGILVMHAAPGKFDDKGLRKEARKGRKLYMASGDYLSVVVDENDDIYVGGAKVLGFAPASNGMVVVVDAIVDPTK
ncbi:MAG: fasciclin domain-containing protein [Salibacteraceae bacterium]